ncbi:MAG: threonine/serine dehydratase [Sphingopyxis sp.]|nr:threonine/serine dehydratase [Sphingopyxis sp.]
MSLFKAIVEASQERPREMQETPLQRSIGLSDLLGCEVLLKCEHLQTTGSFKYRGGANAIRMLDEDARVRGVVTASSGNHGQAVALAGRNAGVAVTVYASSEASPTKLAAIRAYGAELRLLDGPGLDAELIARREAEESGRVFLSPYNDLSVIAGQGTIGLELFESAPDLAAVFVAVGGGGLASGIGTALKGRGSDAMLVGCWPEASPCLMRALEAGYIHDVPETDTISDGTAGGIEPGAITLDLCNEVVDRRVAVSEQEIKRAMWLIAEHDRWLVEGAAGVALAGLIAMADQLRGRKVAVVLCGRNISTAKYLAALNEA